MPSDGDARTRACRDQQLARVSPVQVSVPKPPLAVSPPSWASMLSLPRGPSWSFGPVGTRTPPRPAARKPAGRSGTPFARGAGPLVGVRGR